MNTLNCENVVVGTGISALGIILGLIKNKKKIYVIDPFIHFESSENTKQKTIFCEEKLPLPYSNLLKWKNLDHIKLMQKKIFGGHTNFWGGNSLRFSKDSIADWPINYNEIKKYYDFSEKILNIKHYDDDISNFFGIKKNLKNKIKKDEIFISKKNKNIIFGKSRISREYDNKSKDSDKILNVKNIFIKLIKSKKIILIKGELIKFYKKKNFELILKNSRKKIRCKRLFLATGPLNAKNIIKRSIKTTKKIMQIKQGQAFLIPVLNLSKLSIEKSNVSLSDFNIIYKKFFNKNIYMELKYCPELIKQTIKRRIGFLHHLIPNFFFKKILIIWGFIPSDYSFDYRVVNRKIYINKKNILKKKKVKIELMNVLKNISKDLNLIIFGFLLKFTQFGRGYHIGSNFPMMKKNFKSKFLSTDINGQLNLNNYKNLHIVDSSIFTNIPSSPIGLSLFANALRILNNIMNKKK